MNIVFYIIIILFSFFTVIFLINNKNHDKMNNDKMVLVINTIIRGCARYAAASLQDKSPIVAVLHANYAAGYLWALKDAFSNTEIKRSSGIDIIEFQKKITDVQDSITQLFIKVCPQYASDIDIYLGRIGGEHI